MIKQNRPLTYERLKEVIEYNPETGEFFRLQRRRASNRQSPIYPKGNNKLVICIDGEKYAASHLAIMYSTGVLPLNRVQYRNNNQQDYRLNNLYQYYDRKNEALTQSRLKEVLEYDPTAGYFFKIRSDGKVLYKKIIGYLQGGYIAIDIDRKKYLAHRLVFLYEDGIFPEEGVDVDHIDRNKSNNKRDNLRLVSRQCNARNSSISKNNTSGVIGVGRSQNKWIAEITVGYRHKHLGMFDSFDDAVYCRWEAEVKYEFQNCNTTSSAHEYLKKNNLLNEIDKND